MNKIASSGSVAGNSCRLVYFLVLGTLIIILSACSQKKNTYSILEFSGADKVMNYSKSFYLWQNVSEEERPVSIEANAGDLIVFENYMLVYECDSCSNRFVVEINDSIMYLNRDDNKALMRKSLPDVRLAANEGFCLGSGWLILIIPLIMMIRFLLKHSEKRIKG